MTTMRDAVNQAARLLGVSMAGQVPTGNDADDILVYVQGAIDRLPLLRDGEWTDVLLTSSAAYAAKDGQRISTQGFDPVITLPTTYLNDRNDAVIQEDLSRVHVIGDGLYVWSSDLAAWNKVDGLGLNDPFPFGPRDMPGVVALTVLDAGPEYSVEPSAIIVTRAQAALRSFRSRFYREVVVSADPAYLRMSDTGVSAWEGL